MTDINLAMVLSLKDKLVAPLGRAVDQVERSFKHLDQQASRTARSSATVADNLGKMGRTASATRQAAQEMRNLANESERAHRGVSKLTQVAQGLRTMMSTMTRGVAGAYAFSHVVADPLRQAADYDASLRQLSNTAYAGQSRDVRRAGIKQLDKYIYNSIKFGGGNREQALSALGELVSSGEFNPDQAGSVLPLLMRGSTASGAQASELAQIAIRARQSMGISDAGQMATLLDRAMAAGQAGGFELKDMAKWLPQQMALAKSLGMSGLGGMTELLAANQASVITAGSRDEAGNNLVNLLAKINGADTAQDFKKLGIDLPGTLAAANGKGMNSLQAFVALVDKVVGSDPKFARARAAADAATGDEKKAALSAQADLLQGSAVGKVIQDRQALMALVALMSNRDYLTRVKGQINGGTGSINEAAGLVMEGAAYKFDQAAFERQDKQTKALDTSNEALMKLAEAQTALYERYPVFAAALEGAQVAVTGFAAATAAASVAGMLTGGARATAGKAATSAATRVAATAGVGLLSLGGMAAVAAPILAAYNPNRPFVEGMSDPSLLGSADMSQALTVNVHLDGKQIEATVTKHQDTKARRN